MTRRAFVEQIMGLPVSVHVLAPATAEAVAGAFAAVAQGPEAVTWLSAGATWKAIDHYASSLNEEDKWQKSTFPSPGRALRGM